MDVEVRKDCVHGPGKPHRQASTLLACSGLRLFRRAYLRAELTEDRSENRIVDHGADQALCYVKL